MGVVISLTLVIPAESGITPIERPRTRTPNSVECGWHPGRARCEWPIDPGRPAQQHRKPEGTEPRCSPRSPPHPPTPPPQSAPSASWSSKARPCSERPSVRYWRAIWRSKSWATRSRSRPPRCAGCAPSFMTSTGHPTAAVMIGNAANAFPMMIVKSAMPTA